MVDYSKYLKLLSNNKRYLSMLRNNTLQGTKRTDIFICIPKWANKKITANGAAGNDYMNFKLSRKSNKLNGNNGNDTIYGGRTADTINGGAGKDYLIGFNGNDKIYGCGGNDKIKCGAGADYVSAGSGNDLIYGNAGNDKIVGGTGNDTIYGNEAKDSLYGGAGNDYLYGGDANDYLSGGTGNDNLYGGAGNDTIKADAGTDYVNGGAGADIIHCVSGSNRIVGGDGDDTIHAGSGVDTFEFRDAFDNDTIYHASTNDKIKIFDYDTSEVQFSKSGNHLLISVGSQNTITLANAYLHADDRLATVEIYSGDTLQTSIDIDYDAAAGLYSSVPVLKAEVASWTTSTDSAGIQTTFDENNTSTTELVSAFVPSDLKI